MRILSILILAFTAFHSRVNAQEIKNIEIYAIPFEIRFSYGITSKNITDKYLMYIKIKDDRQFEDILISMSKLKKVENQPPGEVRAAIKINYSKGRSRWLYLTQSGKFMDKKGVIFEANNFLSTSIFSYLPQHYLPNT